MITRMAKRVLIVEDDVDLRDLFRQALVIAGFDVQEAGDGLAALRLIDTNPPDLVVLDLQMPIINGEVVRQELAAQAHLRQIPIVVVTGTAGPHKHLDVYCVLKKPVQPDDLVRTVRSCLAAGSASAT
jgi:CheY-like chemotaxis protein